MPIVIGRSGEHVMTLDEVGHRLIVTQCNDQSGGYDVVMVVTLPENGIELIPWEAPEVFGGAEIQPPFAQPQPAQVQPIQRRTNFPRAS